MAGARRGSGAPDRARFRPGRTACALALAAALGGCLDTGLLSDVAFAPHLDGLPADQPWIALPVGSWVTEGGVRPEAVMACLAPACPVPAAAASVRATGPDAAIMARLVDDPAALGRALSRPAAAAAPQRRIAGPTGAPQPRRAVASVTRLREGAARGFLVRLSRADGSRPAYGAVLAIGDASSIRAVLVITASEDAALRLVRSIATARA